MGFTYVKRSPSFGNFQLTKRQSLEWALATPPQDSWFLKLPTEVRNRIYELALQDIIISPNKNGKKFKSTAQWPNMILNYRSYSLVSRQVYIDIVGGALLYRFAKFSFNSPMLMKNYLSAINPAHKTAIRTVEFRVSSTAKNPSLPSGVFKTLTTLPNLQSLEVSISFAYTLCEYPVGARPPYPPMVLKQYALHKIANEKAWMRLRGCPLVSLDVRFKPGFNPGFYPSFSFWAEDPKLAAFRDFVRGLIGVGR
jgi:hypothetical protein